MGIFEDPQRLILKKLQTRIGHKIAIPLCNNQNVSLMYTRYGLIALPDWDMDTDLDSDFSDTDYYRYTKIGNWDQRVLVRAMQIFLHSDYNVVIGFGVRACVQQST